MPTFRVGYLVGSIARGSINRKLALALARLAPPELPLGEFHVFIGREHSILRNV